MVEINSAEIQERFIRYVKQNTRSDEAHSDQIPSTERQVVFLKKLSKELEEIGLSDVYYNEKDSYLTATIPSNDPDHDYPTFGFIAHIDTADFNSENIQPQIIENYDGGVIPLSDSGYTLDPDVFRQMKNYIGQTLITTDGYTLLGADDKAGVSALMTAAHYLITHPEIKHGDVRVAFGPDEEIGMGATRFDADRFKADFAYTVDGGPVGDLEYETFNAAEAQLTFKGVNVHPGTAKDVMVNAIQMAIDYHNQLPEHDRPEHTEGREGFYHLYKLSGETDHASAEYIIRDHDKEVFEQRKQKMQQLADEMNAKYGEGAVDLVLRDQYYNMGLILEKDMRPVELAKKAYQEIGLTPNIQAVRGGTDGSIITYKGLPTPNLFSGQENMHGRFEFTSVEAMTKSSEMMVQVVIESQHYQEL